MASTYEVNRLEAWIDLIIEKATIEHSVILVLGTE